MTAGAVCDQTDPYQKSRRHGSLNPSSMGSYFKRPGIEHERFIAKWGLDVQAGWL